MGASMLPKKLLDHGDIAERLLSFKSKRDSNSRKYLDAIPEHIINRPNLPRTDSIYVIDDAAYLSLAFPEGVHSLSDEERFTLNSPRHVFCSTSAAVEGADKLGRVLFQRRPTRGELSTAVNLIMSGHIIEAMVKWVDDMEKGTGATVGGIVDSFFGEILEMAPSSSERNFFGRLIASGGTEWMHAVVDLFERQRYKDVAYFSCEKGASDGSDGQIVMKGGN
ncbi:hypothetical protein HDU97_009967 [Phlyctochytrium planicorne]|nr:hypothetical protein HDU97_009967 [Phlyctochytrium planicorne]